jgi:uncharacterized OB-fold protein
MTPMQQMSAHAAEGRLALQQCTGCGTVQYPPRQLCSACLADALEWRATDGEAGEVLATTLLHHSHAAEFYARLPLRIALVRFDAVPVAVCLLAEGCTAGTRVRVTARCDDHARTVLMATP